MDLNPISYQEIYAIAKEAIVNAFRHSKASEIRVEYMTKASVYISNRSNQVFAEHRFQQVAHCACFKRPRRLYVAAISGQDYATGTWINFADLMNRIYAVQLWHLQVHKGHIGLVLAVCPNSLDSIICFCHEDHVVLSFEQARHAVQNQRMIVCTEYANRSRCHRTLYLRHLMTTR